MPDPSSQRAHYDHLVATRRPTEMLLSCGWEDRFDPALLERRPALDAALGRLFDRFLPRQLATVVDVGCGTGYYWKILERRCDRLVGVDLCASMVGAGVAHHGGSGRVLGVAGESHRLPLPDRSASAVVAVDALHHVDRLDRFFAEARRVLAPGGRLLAVEPNVLNPVVFVAHLVPREERGALWPNNPFRAVAAARSVFGYASVRTWPTTYVSGVDSPRALRVVAAVDSALRLPLLRTLSLRRVLVATKRGRPCRP